MSEEPTPSVKRLKDALDALKKDDFTTTIDMLDEAMHEARLERHRRQQRP